MSRKNYKPGQIVTIYGIVYRIMRCKPEAPLYPCACDGCTFGTFYKCAFPMTNLSCVDLIPQDCYFVRLSPIIVMK